MDSTQGKFFVVWIVATLAAGALAWWLGARYRRAVLVEMRAPLAATRDDGVSATLGLAQATAALPSWPAAALPTLAAWRRAEVRLVLALFALSLAIALTRGVLAHLELTDAPFSWTRTFTLAVVFSWPVLAALALLHRWSAARLAAALALWFAAALAFITWRTHAAQTLAGTLQFLAWEMALPALALIALATRRLRAGAPWLWLPLALLAFAALLGLDALAWLVERESPALHALVGWIDAPWVMLLFPLVALALAAWPVMRLARALARAYAQRRVSDLMLHFSAAWGLNLGFDATASGPLVLLPLLWIPLGFGLAHAWQRRRPRTARRAPTLLVLRVFQQDAQAAALFDDVVERWRVAGNTVLIAGTDLVDHTLDTADLFDFLAGGLGARFVREPADVPRRLAAFDWEPDADGRWRVNECYCHDRGWQLALVALVQRADLALMDLRGFQARNAGCRFELATLARAAHLQRVVVLTDERTDLALARADTAAAPASRFAWVALDDATRRRVVARRVRAALAEPDHRQARHAVASPA